MGLAPLHRAPRGIPNGRRGRVFTSAAAAISTFRPDVPHLPLPPLCRLLIPPNFLPKQPLFHPRSSVTRASRVNQVSVVVPALRFRIFLFFFLGFNRRVG